MPYCAPVQKEVWGAAMSEELGKRWGPDGDVWKVVDAAAGATGHPSLGPKRAPTIETREMAHGAPLAPESKTAAPPQALPEARQRIAGQIEEIARRGARERIADQVQEVARRGQNATSGLMVVPRSDMTSRVMTAPNGNQLTVWGQAERSASRTPGHAEAMNNLVLRLAQTGEYEYACLQRNWRTATGRVGSSGLIPDVIGVRRSGTVDAWEVQSANDTEANLRQRLRDGMESLPPDRRGQIGVIPPEPPGN